MVAKLKAWNPQIALSDRVPTAAVRDTLQQLRVSLRAFWHPRLDSKEAETVLEIRQAILVG